MQRTTSGPATGNGANSRPVSFHAGGSNSSLSRTSSSQTTNAEMYQHQPHHGNANGDYLQAPLQKRGSGGGSGSGGGGKSSSQQPPPLASVASAPAAGMMHNTGAVGHANGAKANTTTSNASMGGGNAAHGSHGQGQPHASAAGGSGKGGDGHGDVVPRSGSSLSVDYKDVTIRQRRNTAPEMYVVLC